ncbi:MAG: GNAT family N-acetyltransferase [Polyangiales bacterium]
MSVLFRAMEVADLDEALALWGEAEGVIMRGADSPPAIARYLARNPGLSLVAREETRLVGAVLCGHDGRRGFLHHLAVASTHRRRGIGGALVERCSAALLREGIAKCHLMVHAGNSHGRAFWERRGWAVRDDIELMSRTLTAEPNA